MTICREVDHDQQDCPAPDPRLVSGSAHYHSVETTGARQAWAVGSAQHLTPPPGPTVPVIETWNGTAWMAVNLPSGLSLGSGSVYLSTVSASGPHNVWAYSLAGHWLHDDGATWTTGTLPGRGGRVAAVVADRFDD